MATHAGKPHVGPQHDDDGVITDGEFEEVKPKNGNGSSALATVRGSMQIATPYQTAMLVPHPRDLAADPKTSVLARVLVEAAFCAEDFVYSWEVNDKSSDTGKSTIEGISIEGAMILARNWGNCSPQIAIEEEGPNHWIFRATFIDFETGFNEPRLFRQSKGAASKMARYDVDRALDIAFQIGQSKAIRNTINKAMPEWLKAKALEAAKAAAEAKIKDLTDSVEKAVTYAAGLNVDLARLEKRLGKPKAQWSKTDVVTLRTTFKAIKDKVTTVENEFPPVAATEPTPSATPDATPDAAAAAKPAEKPAEPTSATEATTQPTSPTQPSAAVAASEAKAEPAPAEKPQADAAAPAATPAAEPTKGKAAKEKEPKREREPGEEG